MRRSGDAAAVNAGFGWGAVSADVADSRGKFGRRMPRGADEDSDGGIQRTADAADAGSCGREAGRRFFEFRGLRTESRLRE